MVWGVIYLLLSVWLVSVTLPLELPRLYRGLLSGGAGFVAMILVWILPHLLLLGGSITAAVAWMGGLATLPGQLGLLLHLVSWTIMIRYLWQLRAPMLLLDDQPVDWQVPAFELPAPEQLSLPSAQKQVLKAPAGPELGWIAYLTQRNPQAVAVEVLPGKVYREVEGRRLRLDIYRPRGTQSGEPRASVLVIHGGGWIVGNRRQFKRLCLELALDGHVAYAISYRLAPRHKLPAAVEDCKAAIAWIRAHAASFGSLPDFIAVMGGSAGGHLAAMMALSPDEKSFQPGFEQADTRVQAAILQYGVMDFTSALEHGYNPALKYLLERMVVGVPYSQDPARYHKLEPLRYRPQQVPPLLLVHGTYDRMVLARDSQSMLASLKAAGATNLHHLEIPRAPHAFDILINPYQQRASCLMRRFLAQTFWQWLVAQSSPDAVAS
ncbi:MAG: alpha/beta hydrolase [Myxococcota bacterium]